MRTCAQARTAEEAHSRAREELEQLQAAAAATGKPSDAAQSSGQGALLADDLALREELEDLREVQL